MIRIYVCMCVLQGAAVLNICQVALQVPRQTHAVRYWLQPNVPVAQLSAKETFLQSINI